MKKDENLFWFYRGQKDSMEYSDIQLENNFTKALFIVLRNCPRFRTDFLSKFLKVKTNPRDRLDFEMQTASPQGRILDKKSILFVLSPEKSEIEDKKTKKTYSIPDGWIFTPRENIIVEVKIAGKISEAQLRKHEKLAGRKIKRKHRTWEQLTNFLKVRKNRDDSEVERFLLKQFRQFLEVEGMSTFSGFSEEDLNYFKNTRTEKSGEREARDTIRRKFKNFCKLIRSNKKLPTKLKVRDVGVLKEYSDNIWFPIDIRGKLYYNILVNLNLDELSVSLVSSTQHTEYGRLFVKSLHDREYNLRKFFEKHPELKIVLYRREKGRETENWPTYDVWREVLSISVDMLNRGIIDLGTIRTAFEKLDRQKNCYGGIQLKVSIPRAQLLEKSGEEIVNETINRIQLMTQLARKINDKVK